jgi:ssDNA-binding Zn-finger/Zn-ribbon topoisomerase 1
VKQARKTRKLSDKELAERLRGCPWCGASVVQKDRTTTDAETGKRKFAGTFFGCSSFKDTGCGYWVNLDGVEKVHPLEES